MPNSDDIALIGWSISPMVRNTDKTEAQMLLEVFTGAVIDAGIVRRIQAAHRALGQPLARIQLYRRQAGG